MRTGRFLSCSRHAEVDGISKIIRKIIRKNGKKLTTKNIKREMKKYTFYVIRIMRSDKSRIVLGNAKPCAECTRMMKNYYLPSIIYTDCDGSFIKCNVKDLESSHRSRAQRKFRKCFHSHYVI